MAYLRVIITDDPLTKYPKYGTFLARSLTRSIYFMKHLREKRESKTPSTRVKTALAALMLVLVVPVQPVLAETPTAGTTFVALDQSQTVPAFDITGLIPEPQPNPTVQDVLLNVCKANGYGEDCGKTLLGMLWNESQNVSTAVGDHGKARGYFQIWTGLHNIPVSCAEDLACSATWTLHHMEQHGYPTHVSYAVQCHNGCGFENGYAAKALKNGKRLWDQPLLITQAAPIQLAMN